MSKNIHEIRDPIHNFIRLDSDERKVLNSAPFQRLRHIHQLALTYLVYPGATHRRFEHSLGVMELATRVFDNITRKDRYHEQVRDVIPNSGLELMYWRRVLRMAALCHDIGHLPFSHAAEKELLPEGWNHERLTLEIISSDEMIKIWNNMKPSLNAELIRKLAVGPEKAKGRQFTIWETILSEIIAGDTFGVDRMDYLLRDSHHAGVAYGKFDHYRLIDTLCILPKAEQGSTEPTLGIEHGGLQSAEALIWARYFMFTQLYFHPVRKIYDIHLMDFLKQWLKGGFFSTNINQLQKMTDNEVTAALLNAARNSKKHGHEPARRIVKREHYRLLSERNPKDININPEAVKAIYKSAREKFGKNSVRWDSNKPEGGEQIFPVLMKNGDIATSLELSKTLKDVPVAAVDYVFISPEHRKTAVQWLNKERKKIIMLKKEDEK